MVQQERPATRRSIIIRGLFLAALVVATSIASISLLPRAHADSPYSLNAVPSFTQEGNTVSLILSVTAAVPLTQYHFRFSVTDPAGTISQTLLNYTTGPGQDTFNIVVGYPSSSLSGKNTLVGQYNARVDELFPTAIPGVAGTSFFLSVTDSASYERTQTIMVQASGYNASESVTVTIRTQTTSTQVFSALIAASTSGSIATSWKIPRNATIDNYVVTVTGTSTGKAPPDVQTVSVSRATMTISSIGSLKSSYQRNETMRFFFQPTYPDGTIPSTGAGLLTLTRPDNTNVTLTATYDFIFQTFDAAYQTSVTDEAGNWKVSLIGHAYSDAYGNAVPGILVSNTILLMAIPLTVSVTANTTIAANQQLKLNANVTYPNGSPLQSGTVKAYLLYSGTPTINDTVPMVFDSGLNHWVGTYTIRSSDVGGLWSLVVKASDSAPSPPNSGSATRAITIQNTGGGGILSLPLYFFGIIAALLALLLVAVFFLFKRRKVSHARLKIDLDAVRSEAGRIESTDFFQSVKGQVKKEKDDQ